MKIDTKHMSSQGIALTFEAAAGEFPVLQEMMDQGECRFVDPIAIQVHATPEHDVIKVKGSMTATALLPCGRCLEDFREKLNRRFTLRYSHAIPSDLVPAGEPEVELSAEQMDLILFDGETINLRDAVQEQVVLALPFKPLCREDCKGLCSHCGADLNLAPCGCKGDVGKNPFAVLKNKKWPAQK